MQTTTTKERETKVMYGMTYDKETSHEVVEAIQKAYSNGLRIRLHYGDTKTGKDWMDEYDVRGTIGKSTGQNPIPLLIQTTRSAGGGAILDSCIVRMVSIDKRNKGTILYQHPKWKPAKFLITMDEDDKYPFILWVNGKEYGRCVSEKQAKSLQNKLS